MGSVAGALLVGVVGVSGVVVAQQRPSPRAETLNVICRSAWGAKAAKPGLVAHKVSRATVHHTGVKFRRNAKAPRALRSFQRWHQRHPRKPLPDIAYHYLIDLDGNLYEGRAPAFRGDTHTSYDPSGHLLVCLLGNFEKQEPTREQVQALVGVLSAAVSKHGIRTVDISGHRNHAKTACPGRNLHDLIARGRVRQLVDERIKSGPVELRVVCGRPARTAVRIIEKGKKVPKAVLAGARAPESARVPPAPATSSRRGER